VNRVASIGLLLCSAVALEGCAKPPAAGASVLRWYVFNEPSGAFAAAARACSAAAAGAYTIELVPLPADADQQREQLVRRLAAGDPDVDLIGMDVIWTAEFAAAGWIVPFAAEQAAALQDRLAATLESASWDGRVWAAPFTTNAQLLWYRTDRVPEPPATWDDMLRDAVGLGADGTIEAQGARYEGLTVLFISLLRSAGGRVLDDSGRAVSLDPEPTQRALTLLRRLATSPAAPANFANAREDDSRLGFETGRASFMLNYTFVWPSAHENAPEVARHMAWARWPRASADLPSRVTLGGINVGVAARGKDPGLALRAALCLASPDNQRAAASLGALPPTIEALYDDPAVRAKLPFADALRATLRDAAQRPQTPLYSDVSLAISSALHPPRDIAPAVTAARLRAAVGRALRSEGLL
jgi:multiple sugar transport system substrate-binding protein